MKPAIFCAALVKPGSTLAKQIGNDLPVWGIYEQSPIYRSAELRFGNGSAIEITPDTRSDLHLLTDINTTQLEALFA